MPIQPLLTAYEAQVLLKTTEWRDVYPMDFYAKGKDAWTNYHRDAPESKKSIASEGAK